MVFYIQYFTHSVVDSLLITAYLYWLRYLLKIKKEFVKYFKENCIV